MFSESFTKNLIFILLIQGINGYKPNLFLNLSSIENKEVSTVGTYKAHFLTNDIFQLPLGIDDYIIFEEIYGWIMGRKILIHLHFVNIKIGNDVWNLTEKNSV